MILLPYMVLPFSLVVLPYMIVSSIIYADGATTFSGGVTIQGSVTIYDGVTIFAGGFMGNIEWC